MGYSLLRTQQVAQALGVGVSTVKRWVDAGELEAIRTVGKHRLIPLAEAIRFAESRRLPTEGFRRLSPASTAAEPVGVVDERWRLRLLDLLREGKAEEAKTFLRSAHRRLGSGAGLADELIHPVMERVGHGWMLGEWEVYQEHQASQIVAACLSDLLAEIPPAESGSAPLAVGATPEGDLYTLSLLSAELTLREAGWEVRDLGPNLPLESLTEAVRTYRPAMVFLSVSNLADPASFLRTYTKFQGIAASLGVAVILGGRALSPELLSRLRFDGFGDRMGRLIEFARRLRTTGTASATERKAVTNDLN